MPRAIDGFQKAFGYRRYGSPRKQQGSVKTKESAKKHETINENAVLNLRAHLVSKYALGRMYATEVAELAFLIMQLGVPGFEDLAINPSNKSFVNNACKRIRKAFDLRAIEDSFCDVLVPMSSEEGQRVWKASPALPLQMLLMEELSAAPDLVLEAVSELDTENWKNNSVRRDSDKDDLIIPYGIFIDGAPYKGKGAGTRASIQTYFVNLLGMPTRRIIGSLLKDLFCGETCGCPCKGKCTTDALETFFVYHGTWAADGIWAPCQSHEQPWSYEPALERAGKRVQFRGKTVRFILLEIRDDWDQYASTFGFPRHNQAPRFCPWCPCLRGAMHDPETPAMFHHADFMADIRNCIIIATVNATDAALIFETLFLDFRDSKGMHGRCVGKPLQIHDVRNNSIVKLHKYDRLEMRYSVPDIHCNVSDLKGNGTYTLCFWRRNSECRFRFLSVWFSIPGVLFDYCMIDDLHGLDLGPTQKLCGHIMVSVLKSGVYGNPSTEAGMKTGCRALSRDLKRHYYGNRTKHVSQLGRVTLNMLKWHKKEDGGDLNCKGAEARGCLPFVHQLVSRPKVQQLLGRSGKNLQKATGALLDAYKLMKTSKRKIDSAMLGRYFARVAKYSIAAGVRCTPKFHQMQHYEALTARAGNPALFSAYADESHNRFVVAAAQACFTKEFSGRILSREILHLRTLRRQAGRAYAFESL